MEPERPITILSGFAPHRVGDRHVMVDGTGGGWLVVDEEARREMDRLRGQTHSESRLRRQLGQEFVDALLASGLAVEGESENLAPGYPCWDHSDQIFVVLHLTDECSFSCAYCYADSAGRGRGHSLGGDVLERVCQLLIKSDPNHVYIGLHGGEPLLWLAEHLGAIEAFLDELAAAGKCVRPHMQTSGSLLDKDVFRFIKDRAIPLGVSCDGPPWLNDQYRKWNSGRGTSRQVEACFDLLHRMEIPFGVICSVGAHSYNHAGDIVEYFARRNVKRVRFNPVWPYPRAKDAGISVTPVQYLSFYRDLLDVLNEHNREGQTSPVMSVDLGWLLKNVRSRQRAFMCLRSPCGAGGSPMLAVGPDGTIYPCEKMVALPQYRAGNVFSVSSIPELRALPVMHRVRRRTVDAIRRCSRCDWRALCGGGCPSDVSATGGDLFDPDPNCEFYRNIFKELMVRIVEDDGFLDRVYAPEIRACGAVENPL